MTKRVYNFNPGPSTLPLDVLKKLQADLLNFENTGMSIMEISHRSPEYDKVHNDAIALTKELMGLDDSYKVLFVGGGASTQFAYIPMNFLHKGQVGAYVDTGTWSTKAIKEAEEGDILKPGRVLIAPGHSHLTIEKKQLANVVRLSPTEAVNGHCPSVGVLFDSVYKVYGNRNIAVIMTGMGSDGSSSIADCADRNVARLRF